MPALHRIGVTGSSGFIARHVITNLIASNYEVVGLDRMEAPGGPLKGRYGPFHYVISTYLGDIRDLNACMEFASHVDGIIHLAGILGTSESFANPFVSLETNITGGLNVFTACNKYEIPCSVITVGNWFMDNPYSISKYTTERYAHMMNLYQGGRINLVRAMNAYGEYQKPGKPFGPHAVRKIVPTFVCRALCDMPIQIYGDGSQVSDLIYVGDVAQALVKALRFASKGLICDTPIDIGPSKNHTVLEVAKMVLDICDKDWEAIEFMEPRLGEDLTKAVSADTTLVESFLLMQEKTFMPLDQGLRKTIGWFKKVRGEWWSGPDGE